MRRTIFTIAKRFSWALSAGCLLLVNPLCGTELNDTGAVGPTEFMVFEREHGKILRDLCRQQAIELEKGNALPDHVHLLLRVPPKYSIANTVEFLKGKSALRINRDLGKVKVSLYGRAIWSRGYCVRPVGLDEAMITEYIQNQEKHERDQERGLFDID